MEAITREEQFLTAIAEGDSSGVVPVTREEMYLAYIAGQNVVPPEPITRKEKFLSLIPPIGSGGGSGVTIKNQNKTFTENGTYKADSGYTGLGTVTVNVPETVPVLESLAVTENGEYTPGSGVDGFSKVTVNVETGGGGYSIEDIAKGNLGTNLVIDLPNTLAPNSYAFAYADMETLTINSEVNGEQSECVFAKCANLKNVVFNARTKFGVNAFNGCTALERVEATKSSSWCNSYAFKNLTALKEAIVPKLNGNGYHTFYGCTSLQLAELCDIGSISGEILRNCTALTTLVLSSQSVIALGNVSALYGTPFASDGTGGTVYCPEALIEEYKVATNWATLYEAGTCTFVAIEGSEYE